MDSKLIPIAFDTRCRGVLEHAMSDGLFAARGMAFAQNDLAIDKDGGQTVCSGTFYSQTGALGAVNIVWEDFWGPFPYSIFAYSGRECALRDDIAFEELCARCFQVNQATPFANVGYRIDEPEKFKRKKRGNVVCIAGLPLLPFEAEVYYQNNAVALETMMVGAMESAFGGEKLIADLFEGYLECG